MKRTAILSTAAVVAFGGSMLVATSTAQAVTEHCDSSVYPNKVELDGSSTTVATGLAPGTEVCIKAGTGTTIVFVDADGNITQSALTNKNGMSLGISYYAYGGQSSGS